MLCIEDRHEGTGRDNLPEPGRERASVTFCRTSQMQNCLEGVKPSTRGSDLSLSVPSQILYWSWLGSLDIAASLCRIDEEASLDREKSKVNMGTGDPQKTAGNCFHYAVLLELSPRHRCTSLKHRCSWSISWLETPVSFRTKERFSLSQCGWSDSVCGTKRPFLECCRGPPLVLWDRKQRISNTQAYSRGRWHSCSAPTV